MRGNAARGFLTHRWLLAAASGVAMTEAALLAALAPAARVLAPQVTALPPLAIYHDLRWLDGYGLSWPAFAALAVAAVVLRSAMSAGLVRLAWPAGSPPPPLGSLLWSCVTLTVFAGLLLSPVAALMFGTSVVPFSWPFLASLALLLLLTLPMSHGAARVCWWRTLPPPTAAGWLLADFASLTVAAVVIGRLPVGWSVVVAGLAGLVNARAWFGLTTAVANGRQHAVAHVPLAPLAAVTAIALVVGVTRLAFSEGVRSAAPHHTGSSRPTPAAASPSAGKASTARTDPPVATAGSAQAGQRVTRQQRHAATSALGRHAVLVVAGFGSSCCNHAGDVHRVMPGWWVQQFSYRGLSRGGAPLPQGAQASNLPLSVLGNRVTRQVWRLYAETHRPVSIVAESEGTLGVDAMLALHPRVPLDSVVLLSPIVAPGQGTYPRPLGSGPGTVAGSELRAVIWFVGGLSPFGTTGAQTFVSSVSSLGARFAVAAHQRPVRSVQFVPLADAVTLPACALPANTWVVPAFHGELLGDPSVLAAVRAFLLHRPVPSRPGLRRTAEIVSAGAAAWRMPLPAIPKPPCQP